MPGMSSPSLPLACCQLPSPVGPLTLAADDAALQVLAFACEDVAQSPPAAWQLVASAEHAVLHEAAQQLQAYFAGRLRAFDLPLQPSGTPFQQRVWQALRRIPYGDTRSYGEVAQRIASPKASRAVGAASGANPIAIIIPCHRVVGAAGQLTGFGGGLPAKQTLLALEHAAIQPSLW